MEAVCLNGYAARASTIIDGIIKTGESGFGGGGCSSMPIAKRRALKSLANQVRTHFEGRKGWTQWPKLTPVEQKKWLDKVAETLQWDELQGGKVANLHSISAGEFSRALVGSLA